MTTYFNPNITVESKAKSVSIILTLSVLTVTSSRIKTVFPEGQTSFWIDGMEVLISGARSTLLMVYSMVRSTPQTANLLVRSRPPKELFQVQSKPPHWMES